MVRKFDTLEEYNSKIQNGTIEWKGWLQTRKEIEKQFAGEYLNTKLPYEIVPMEIIRTTYLSAPEKELYILILAHADNESGTSFVRSETLADMLGKSEKQIRRILNQLQEKQIIDIASYSSKAKRYIILKPLPLQLYLDIVFVGDFNTKFCKYVQLCIKQLQAQEISMQTN